MKTSGKRLLAAAIPIALAAAVAGAASPASAQEKKPNIMLLRVRRHRLRRSRPLRRRRRARHADAQHRPPGRRGNDFFSFYAQPSCTPGRAAMQTGRIPNRSGMTTVAFQGQGGGLPQAEWTLGSVLKTAGYKTYFTGKWHLGEADYALPNAQGYDVMEHCFLYHSTPTPTATRPGSRTWIPKLREMFDKVTKGALSGKAGEPAKRGLQGQRRSTSTRRKKGVVGIPFFDKYVEQAALEVPGRGRQDPDSPFFINVNFMKVHQPNMPAPEFEHKSLSKIEVRRLGRRARRAHRPHHGQARASSASTRTRWCSTRPTTAPGRTSIPTPATRRSAAPRARCAKAATACRRSPYGRARSRPARKNHDIVGGLDLMATFAVRRRRRSCRRRIAKDSRSSSTATTCRRCCSAPASRRATRGSTSPRTSSRPGAARVGNYKAVFNLRGDDGQPTGGLAVDSNLGWKGADEVRRHRAADLRPVAGPAGALRHLHEQLHRAHLDDGDVQRGDRASLMKTYVKYPPRKLQSEVYTGPITLSQYQRFQCVRRPARKGRRQHSAAYRQLSFARPTPPRQKRASFNMDQVLSTPRSGSLTCRSGGRLALPPVSRKTSGRALGAMVPVSEHWLVGVGVMFHAAGGRCRRQPDRRRPRQRQPVLGRPRRRLRLVSGRRGGWSP